MRRTVTHIIETVTPEPGRLICALSGLFEFQERRGWNVHIVSKENLDGASAAIEAAKIIHVHGPTGRVVRQLWPLLKSARKRYVVSTYATQPPGLSRRNGWQWSRFGRVGKLIRRAWCVHTLTERESDLFKRRQGAQRTKVLPMGIDLASSDGAPNGPGDSVCDGKRMILFLGPLHPEQGLVPFLKAGAFVAEQFEDLGLVLAGRAEPEWIAVLTAAIRRQGFEDRVKLIADPEPGQVQQLLRDTVLLAAPFFGDCCPISALQALAAGKAVVISPGCNLPEVGLRKAGWIVEPKRRELQRVLHEAFSCSAADLQEMGERGSGLVKDLYSWDRLGHEYLNLYARVLGAA